MIDFTQPIYEPDPERAEREARDHAIAEGRHAFQCFVPYNGCPPFRDSDRTVNWRMGWRWEKEDWERRKAGNAALAEGTMVRKAAKD